MTDADAKALADVLKKNYGGMHISTVAIEKRIDNDSFKAVPYLMQKYFKAELLPPGLRPNIPVSIDLLDVNKGKDKG